MEKKVNNTCTNLDFILIPEDIPDLGAKAGDTGVVDFVYDSGRGLHVEITREDGTSVGFVQLEADSRDNGEHVWRVAAYSKIDTRSS